MACRRARRSRGDPNEHFALSLDRENYERAKRDLAQLGVSFEEWDHGICDSLYIEDPEGHQIELACYRSAPPPAAGAADRVRHA